MVNSKRESFQCDSYLGLQVVILKLAGFWPIRSASRHGIQEQVTKYFGQMYSYFLFLNLVHMALSQIISISIKWNGSIMEISAHLMETIVALTAMGFQVVFYLEYDNFKKLFDLIDSQMRPRSLKGITFADMRRAYKLAKYFTCAWVSLSVTATAHYALNPILDRERRHPVPVVYTFDVMESPYFEIEYFLQGVAQLQYGFAFSIIISLVSSVSIMLCGQLDILYCGIHNLLYSALLKRGDYASIRMVKELQSNWISENRDSIRYTYSHESFEDLAELPVHLEDCTGCESKISLPYREYDEEVLEILKDLIRHHQFIISTARLIERSFRSLFFLELFEHTAYTCIITYAITMHREIDNTFIHLVFYFFMVNLDTFLMCYTPHILAEQSLELVDAIFKSPFYLYGPSVQKFLYFMILNCKKDLHMTCGKIFRVDLTTSFRIVKGAFSYFMLLKNIQK